MIIQKSTKTSRKYSNIAIFLLILTTLLWGTTFIITRTLVQDIPIFLYIGVRCLIALIGFTPFLIYIKRINQKIIVFGFFSGFIYFLAMVFQTWGLQTTTAGKGGFITGLSTVIVPFFAYIFFKKDLNKKIFISVGLSVIGMAFLLLEGEKGIIIGDWLVLGCAFLFAYFIVVNDKYVRLVDVYLYSIVQMTVVTVLSFSFSFFLNESYNLFSIDPFWPFLLIMIYMGIGVSTSTFENLFSKSIGHFVFKIMINLFFLSRCSLKSVSWMSNNWSTNLGVLFRTRKYF